MNWSFLSSGSRISRRGASTSHGGVNYRSGYVSKILFVEMKEFGPLGACAGAGPPGPTLSHGVGISYQLQHFSSSELCFSIRNSKLFIGPTRCLRPAKQRPCPLLIPRWLAKQYGGHQHSNRHPDTHFEFSLLLVETRASHRLFLK